MEATPKPIFRFGLFRVDAESGRLFRADERIKLQEQPFRVLCILVERAGQVVKRDELRDALWPTGTYVEFDGSLNAALKRLRSALGDSADNPIFIETIPKRGYRFLAPVSVEATSSSGVLVEQYPSDSLDPVELAHGETVSVAKAKWSDRSAYTVTLALVLVLGVFSYHRLISAKEEFRPHSTLTGPIVPRPGVAVLGFTNSSNHPGDAWISTALSEMLHTELGVGDKIRLASGEDIAHLRMGSPWMETDTLGQATASRIGAALSSDMLVLGSYACIGQTGKRRIRVDIRLQEAATGRVLGEITETDDEANLFHVASTVGAGLRRKLNLPRSTEEDQVLELASLPTNTEAARFYALGLGKFREYDFLAARDLLTQAVKADPKFPLSHSMLARAYAQLGYQQLHKREAKTALDLSASLSSVDRAFVEADYDESLARHDDAASAYRALFSRFPDNVDYGLQLAAIETISGHREQALETLAQLRRLPTPASDDPRIDLAEARAIPNNKPNSLRLVSTALTKSANQGRKLVYAAARKEECINLVYGDDPQQGEAACADAYRTFLGAGNRLAAADSLRLIGDSQGVRGRVDEAMATYQSALKLLSEMGDQEKTGAVLNNMANLVANTGKLGEAERLYREAQHHFEAAGDPENVCTAIGNIGDIAALRGNLSEATSLYKKSLDVAGSLEPSVSGYALYKLAIVELEQGDLNGAGQHAKKAVDVLQQVQGGYQYLTAAMSVSADIALAQGDLDRARQKYEEILAIRKKAGEPGLVAETQASLAELAIEKGHPEQAEPLLHVAIEEFEKEKAIPEAAAAYTSMSQAQAMQAKLDDARKTIAHANELSRGNPDPTLQLALEMRQAELKIAAAPAGSAGQTQRAVGQRQLEAIIVQSRRLGYRGQEYEARLTLLESESSQHLPTAEKHAAELEKQAGNDGFLLISRKAGAIAKELHP